MTVQDIYSKVQDGKIKSDIELQREIVYPLEKQQLVIDSIVKSIPLPAFYLWQNDDGTLEVLDGKQRIHSIKRFKNNDIRYEGKLWAETPSDIQDIINKTELPIIIISGDEQLKRTVFYRINTLGEALSDFEVLNGLYSGEYLRGLTTFVSGDKAAIKVLGDNARGKAAIAALKHLVMLKNEKNYNDYVEANQSNSFDKDQRFLSKPYKFITTIFSDKVLKAIDHTHLVHLAFDNTNDKTLWQQHKNEINDRIETFIISDEWKLLNKTGKCQLCDDIIFSVVGGITTDPQRLFTPEQKRQHIERLEAVGDVIDTDKPRHKYQCKGACEQWFYDDELEMDHILPWSKGGRTELSNAQLLCRTCNSSKGNGA